MIDIRALELLCSRLCHDLISPVGAIRNGLEIIEETVSPVTSGFGDEAMQLIAHAAGQADSRLRLFRLAYGQAGREAASFSDARMAAQGWFATGRTRLNWEQGDLGDNVARRRGAVKMLLNLLVVADEALTHGGTVSVSGAGASNAGTVVVTAQGRPGRLSDEMTAALAGKTAGEALTPRLVHAYMTGRFADAYAVTIDTAEVAPERLELRMRW